jgi:two-component system, response regulator PdtaR
MEYSFPNDTNLKIREKTGRKVHCMECSSTEVKEMSSEKILIVEENDYFAYSLKKILTSSGYTVAGIASTGMNAISMTEKKHPDLILMDIWLKGYMDGITATKKILSRVYLPIILMTPYFDEVLVKKANYVPYGYLTKPVDEKNLLAIIRRTLIYHAWGKISVDNLNQCFNGYMEVVCSKAQEYDSSISISDTNTSLLPKAYWMVN